MTLLSDLFPGRLLISRTIYPYQAGAYTITAPAGAAFIRASLGGGGAHLAGGAFARVKAAATPGETFNLVVGNCATASPAGAAGNTVLTRNTGSVIICRADGAESGVAGSVAGSIGDVTRAGTVGNTTLSGSSGGDDADPYPLGYGGFGAYMDHAGDAAQGNRWLAPYWGAGGLLSVVSTDAGAVNDIWPGQGRATIEFFRADPGY